ncbi:hypothetical protein [Kitasatospora sp. GAS1066B]|uniref:hypothetical protein n=1 Tax=Kitasatospora sp. GAS1066B TaxID=3156271 RepID=UPI00351316D4
MLKQTAIAVTMFTLTVAGPTVANAAPQQTNTTAQAVHGTGVPSGDTIKEALASGKKVRIDAGMKYSKFDSAVADRNGYRILTAPNGVQYSVKKDATATQLDAALKKAEAVKPTPAAEGSVVPNVSTELWGDCGGAFLEFDPWGGGTVAGDLYTGFTMTESATNYFSWDVTLVDPGGVSNQEWPPERIGTTNGWSDHRALRHLSAGAAYSEINPTYSWALLVDGGTCTAGPATVHYTIS